jgi:hypothetical protein
MEIWNKLAQPPASALKTITGGRLKGMTDVNPQWRYQAMTEQFGVCGIGWKYEIKRVWNESGCNGVVFAFAEVLLHIKSEDTWSDPIPGIGGSQLVSKESAGLYPSDEGYKMAVTDALSVAMKMLGMAADVYAGRWDGSKYRDRPSEQKSDKKPAEGNEELSAKQWNYMKKVAGDKDLTEYELIDMVKWVAEKEKITPRHWKIAKMMLPEDNFEKVFTEYCEYQASKNNANDIPY